MLDHGVPVVVMLCDLTEDKVCHIYAGRSYHILCLLVNQTNNTQSMCYYWPEQGVSMFGEFYVKILSKVEGDGFILRNFKIQKEVGDG